MELNDCLIYQQWTSVLRNTIMLLLAEVTNNPFNGAVEFHCGLCPDCVHGAALCVDSKC